jgi:hypothetical protein
MPALKGPAYDLFIRMSSVQRAATPVWRRYGVYAAIAVVYAVACRVMLAPIFNFNHPATASYVGDVRAFIWVLAWDNHAVLDGVPSLFNANKLYPLPNTLAYGEHLFGISLFTLPVYAITRNPVLAYNLVWLLCYVLTAAVGHFIAWRYTRDHLASLAAGMMGAFCFYRMHHGHGHLNLLWGFWIPLSFVAMERWTAKPTWTRLAVWTGTVVLQALAAWYQAVLIAVADLLFLLWLFAVERRRMPLRTFLRHGVAGLLVAFAVVWPFARPYFILHQEPPSYSAGASADLVGWLVPPENTFAGQWLLARGVKGPWGPRWIWGELTVYLGWVALILGAAGAVVSLRSSDENLRRSRFYIALGIFAAVLALGPSAREVASGTYGWSPFGLLSHVPGFSLFRIPARYTQFLNLALAVLAAVACAALHRRFGVAGRIVSVVAIAAFLAESYVVNMPGGQPQPAAIPPVYRHIATLPPGPVLSLPDYANTPSWFDEANYSYYSTAHWQPTVNGDSREWPAEFLALTARLKTFPAPDAALAMRDIGLRYVVVHAAQAGAAAMIEPATASDDYRLLARFDRDYLFAVVPKEAH